MVTEETIDGYLFTTDKGSVDILYVHNFLSTESYWAQNIPLSYVIKSIENSLTISIFDNDKQIGFARVISDYTTFAWLADVFVDKAHRGKGISKNLIRFIQSLDQLKDFRRFVLATKDAHSLYARFGFKPLGSPDRFMEIHRPDPYKNMTT